MRQLSRLLFAVGIIAFATSMTAVSCGKTAGGNNNNNNNSGNNGGSGGGDGNGGNGGDGGCTGICPTTNLTLTATGAPPPAWVRVSGNTVTISAAGLAGKITPHSDANDDNRGFDDLPRGGPFTTLFKINYPGAGAVMFFVNRASVSTNSITMPATVATCQSSETDDNTFATGGNGTCRVYTAGGNQVDFRNYLGTVFNNTDTANHARGMMRCNIGFSGGFDTMVGANRVITDTVTFVANPGTFCQIGVVNNGLGTGVEIDDAWVGDTRSTTEVELHAIGIDVSGKTIPQFSSEAGYNLAKFITAHDNAAFKRLLQNNEWADLKFKVKIVTAANF